MQLSSQSIPERSRLQVVLLLWLLQLTAAQALELTNVQTAFRHGEYAGVIAACQQTNLPVYEWEDWKLLHAKALLATGRYPEAEAVISNAIVQSSFSLRLRALGIETARYSGNLLMASTRLKEIDALAASRRWAYRDPANLVALGQVALILGADPRVILERLYQPARAAAPDLREAWLASGQLALDKHDFALAASTLAEAQERFANDPDILCGLAQAYQPSDRGKMLELLQAGLEQNPNHIPCLLLLVDHSIDAEEYVEARRILEQILKVNPWSPPAWAYQAVLEHLQNNTSGETAARQKGLHFWNSNPEVDHLIGMKLSQKYRFAEGAACQRRALDFEPDYLPAQIQLAEDLLRLGQESEGWRLAELVHQRDEYDVTAYNLVTLHQTMEKFQTVTNEDFVLRMGATEAELYGDRALNLLMQAKARLSDRYGIELTRPTYVEIFPEQKDFAVRTFGMPGNPGYLGVCFGRVITANSPASQAGHPANWEAVLWHEFTHVITLQLTRNKMPRWLSEGISVFEELQKDPAWGQHMNPRYREMVLGEALVPVSELSGAFLSPKSELHLQFAYYQSALVVEFLVRQFGFDQLRAVLVDLGQGIEINDALPKHTLPMEQLETEFANFAKARAEALGPGLDWNKPELVRAPDSPTVITAPTQTTNTMPQTDNYWILMNQAQELVREQKWAEAELPLEKVILHYPDQTGSANAYSLLAVAKRNLHDEPGERVALENWTALEADVPDAFLRLMELAEQNADWAGAARNARRFIAVNPFAPQPYRILAKAGESQGNTNSAIDALRKLLLLQPADPADVHFQLARLLHLNNDPAAKRQVLMALEAAPRFRAAQELLLQLAQAGASSTNQPEATVP